MPSHATEFQREFMRELYRTHKGDEAAACAAYAKAETEGLLFRQAGDLKMPPEAYAKALLLDGLTKGWIGSAGGFGELPK